METAFVKYALPPEIIAQIKAEVKQSVIEALRENVEAIRSEEKKLTRKEAAAKLKISLTTLDKHLDAKTIRPQIIGRRVLIPESEIENFLKQSA